jgi:apolipoprotein N-acyltransferase
MASTALLKEAAVTQTVPLLKEKTVYTTIGDLFAQVCLAIVLLTALLEIVRWGIKKIEN